MSEEPPVESDQPDQPPSNSYDPFTNPTPASQIKVGNHISLEQVYRVTSVETSKTGKHGHAKVNITGVSVLTGKSCNLLVKSDETMYLVYPIHSQYVLINIMGDQMTILDEKIGNSIDIPLPPGEAGEEITTRFGNGENLTINTISFRTSAIDDQIYRSFRPTI